VSAPNDTSDANALESCLHKVHVRGLDNLTTKDVRAFALEYFDTHQPSHIEWIDDTSANIVYETPEIAQEALVAFAAVEIADASQLPLLQTISAKHFPLHPQTNLEVRIAVVGDRKQAGARERSRFYLFNPEYDPAERRRRAGYKGRQYRDREDSGYRSQRYDDREQQKREREADFDASLYDDDEAAIAKRSMRDNRYQGSSSGGESRGRDSRGLRFGGAAAGKELFPERVEGGSGRLRNRSASPLCDSDGDQDMRESRGARSRQQDTAASANRLKAQMIKTRLKEASSTKELFPHKTAGQRHSGAFDAAHETVADLFANKMPVPFVDGSGDAPMDTPSLAARITGRSSGNDPAGFSIRGAAKVIPASVFSIKGAAASSGPKVKELFPSTLGDNAGKELFSERLNGRGARRQKASDLFY
jgi:hypothetical protein